MTINDWLKGSEWRLKDASIITSRLDCLILLEDETCKDRSWLLAHPEYTLQASKIENLNTKIAQRVSHIPLAYIRGKAEFYGREFVVNEHVLVPRSESETIITHLKELNLHPGSCVLDVGTGSGCLAITAALELPDAFVQACDIDPSCIELAEQNVENLDASVHFFVSDLLQDASQCDVLLCNLPYVPKDYQINQAATHEPKLALFAGSDGLDLYRKLFRQITTSSWKPATIIAESLPESHNELVQIAKAAGYLLQQTDDFVQVYSTS